MSRFYVGQKVRIVRARLSKFLIGMETTVIALDVLGSHAGVEYVGTQCAAKNVNNIHFVASDGEIEPITDSYDKTTWDTCIWKPEHLRVPA